MTERIRIPETSSDRWAVRHAPGSGPTGVWIGSIIDETTDVKRMTVHQDGDIWTLSVYLSYEEQIAPVTTVPLGGDELTGVESAILEAVALGAREAGKTETHLYEVVVPYTGYSVFKVSARSEAEAVSIVHYGIRRGDDGFYNETEPDVEFEYSLNSMTAERNPD